MAVEENNDGIGRPKKRLAASKDAEGDGDIGSVFFKVAAVAWDFFDTEDTRAIRALSHEGRYLFDRLRVGIWVRLGSEESPLDPAPEELTRAVGAALSRGTKPSTVRAQMAWLEGEQNLAVRERQILALFEACSVSSLPLERVDLSGHLHLTSAITAVIAARAPRTLRIGCAGFCDVEDHAWWLDEQHYAALELLQGCLPRLEDLDLYGIFVWPMSNLRCLRLGTGLRKLSLNLYMEEDMPMQVEDLESGLRAITCLRQLRDLRVYSTNWECTPAYFPDDNPETCALDLSFLSALSSLTELHLNINQCYQENHAAKFALLTQFDQAHWRQVWEHQSASVVAALRAMPELSHLRLRGVQLDVRDVARMSALEELRLMSLLLPPPGGEGEPGRDAVAEPRLWSPPPRLRCLRLGVLSPSLLAAISLPPSLTELGVLWGQGLDFARLDLDPADLQAGDGALEAPHLAPGAVRAAVSAIELLRRHTPQDKQSTMVINGKGWEKPLLPPVEPAPVGEDAEAAVAAPPPLGGHAPWLSALGRLERLRELTLARILLDVLDVRALADNLPNLKVLELKGSPFPAAALPCLAAMPSLERFIFCWGASVVRYQAWRLEEVTLTAMLQLVLGAPSLTTVTVRDTTLEEPLRTALLQKVQRTLAARRPGVSISID